MRLSGKYTHTRSLTANEVRGIKDILAAYDVLRGEKLLKNGSNSTDILGRQCVILTDNFPSYLRIWTPNQFTRSEVEEVLKEWPSQSIECVYFTSAVDYTGESDYAVIWPQKGQMVYYDK